MINPAGLHADRPGYEDLRSHGRNPLLAVDWNTEFFDDVAQLVAAWLRVPAHGDIHWMLSARGVVQSLCMFEIQQAAIEGRRSPSVWNVRTMLTEADKFDPKTSKPLKGLAATALRIIAEGGPQAASLIGRFVDSNEETQGVRATADGATQWMLSPIIAKDMSVAGGVDFRELGERAVLLLRDFAASYGRDALGLCARGDLVGAGGNAGPPAEYGLHLLGQ